MGGQFPVPVPFVVPPLLDAVTIEHGVKELLFAMPLDGTCDSICQSEQGKGYGKKDPVWRQHSSSFLIPSGVPVPMAIKKPPEGGGSETDFDSGSVIRSNHNT